MKDQTLYKHFTNGTINIFCLPENCPDGFYPGITRKKKDRKKPGNAGKKHFTNGVKNIFCFEIDCPEGFYQGITKIKNTKKIVRKSKSKIFFSSIKDDEEKIKDFTNLFLSKSLKDCADHFNVSPAIIKKVGEYLNLTRDPSVKEKVKKIRQQKIKNTCLEKYGVIAPAQSDIIKEKTKNKMFDKYGISKGGRAIYTLKSEYSEVFKELIFNKQKSEEFLKNKNKQVTRQELALEFNCPLYAVQNWIYKFNLIEYFKFAPSHYEDEIFEYLKSLNIINIERHNRYVLDGKELDIYLPDNKIGIEFNGTYWHSVSNVPMNYHEHKSKLAESCGIHLIHIYEFEWNDPDQQQKIKNLLAIVTHNVSSRVYARKCEVREISNKGAKEFNNKNHLQGHRNAQVTLGLFYNDNLVQLMSFSKTKYNRNIKGDNSWEIIRGCPGSNNLVIGGVSKLFKHFILKYDPDKIFSYCDFNKFDGHGYNSIGMKFIGYTGPNKWWVLKTGEVVSRSPSKYKFYKENSIDVIWGSGSKKYEWIKSNMEVK